MGDDKLVTVACDAESTDLLATAHDGIEAGKYIDYAWSGIFDKVVDAYASETQTHRRNWKSKYGGALLKTNNTQESAQLNPILTPQQCKIPLPQSNRENIIRILGYADKLGGI